ncbi:MAG: hypothetical protein V9H25_15190 [Candidatus Competibacter sp.]
MASISPWPWNRASTPWASSPNGQGLAGQVRDERLEVGHVQFGFGRPGGFGQRLTDFAVQFQGGRAGDLMGQLQAVAQFAPHLAFAVESAVIRVPQLPGELEVQRISAGRVDSAAGPSLAQGCADFQGFDGQGVGFGARLEVDGVHLEGCAARRVDADGAALQIGDDDAQRQPDLGQGERLGRRGGFRVGRR